MNIQDNYIKAILKESKQLAAIAHYLEFENKTLIKALKAKKKKWNRGKKLNLLSEEDDSLQLFLSPRGQVAYNFAYNKEFKKK